MAEEMDKINTEMISEGKKYILIGPGRWGTRDRWIGIPVVWPQISNAKVIVETSLEGFPAGCLLRISFLPQCHLDECRLFLCSAGNSDSYIRFDVLRRQKNI